MPKFSDILDILRCPKCSGSTLNVDSELIGCSNCGREYSVSEGVLILGGSGDKEEEGVLSQEKEDWDKNSDFYIREVESPLFKILNAYKVRTFALNEEKKSLKILDFGSGTGYFSKLIVGWGHIPITLDFAVNMLRLGKKVYEIPLPVQSVAPPLVFKDQSFDAIVINGILHHCKAQNVFEETVLELHRILKPGGLLLLFDRNGAFLGRHLHHFVLSVKKMVERGGHFSSSASRHEPDFNDNDIKYILETGFQIDKRRYISTLFTFMGIVITNSIEYAGMRRIADFLRYLLWPFLVLCEKIFPFKCLTVEQCVRFVKNN